MKMRDNIGGKIRNPANVDFAALARATALRLVCFRLPVIHFRPLSQSTSSQLYKMVSEMLVYTVCPFYVATYYMKWVTTSRTDSSVCIMLLH